MPTPKPGYVLLYVTLLGIVCSPAKAGNTGGVFGPTVSAGDQSLEYRYADADDTPSAAGGPVHRLHYQHAFNDRYRGRIVGQAQDQHGELDFDQLRLELQWQFQDAKVSTSREGRWSRWDSALRADLVKRDGGRPGDINLNWTNQWQLSPRWQLRGLLLTTRQIGDTRAPGLQIGSRFSLGYTYQRDHSVVLESFNSHGPLNELGIADTQLQQAGPALSGRWQHLGYKLSYLRGLNGTTPDDTLALWLNLAL